MAAEYPTPTNHRFVDRTGEKYGKWTVISFQGVKSNNSRWLCRCECGTENVTYLSSIKKSPQCRRCGQLKHGLSHTPECRAWHHMRGRCENPDHPSYSRYGGRGITVCDEWQDFEAFYRDMGTRPTPKHTLERIDNDGDYCKDNCRWATRKEQARNTRRNRMLTFNGVTQSIPDWADQVGISRDTLSGRIKVGWTAEEALTLPPHARSKRPK